MSPSRSITLLRGVLGGVVLVQSIQALLPHPGGPNHFIQDVRIDEKMLSQTPFGVQTIFS